MANRLASAMSPYLQQHQDNPVDWWEWSDDAFAEARRRGVPVLLSVGYSACHWCHVMAHESFEDDAIAARLNERYVAIKVDREERPDIDAVYMAATQALTGQGGWPMTVFLTPDAQPFYAGTYFPPIPRHGLPSFGQLLDAVHESWTTDRGSVLDAAARITGALSDYRVPPAEDALDPDSVVAALDAGVDVMSGQYDVTRGGFGGAPKFPPSMVLEFLLRHHARTLDPRALAMASGTCAAMARGGMYDQLAGGFARYSVDASWVVPHFEKMLYDNGLLLRAYAHWWRSTGDPLAERVIRETVKFLLRDLRTASGAFAAALDADAAGVEGATYAWTPQQLDDVLGVVDGPWAAALLEVTVHGTFEHGTSVLQLLADPDDVPRWQRVRDHLLQARRARPQPARDDKVVASWNGMAIAALADAGALLGERAWVQAAVDAAHAVLDVHADDEGRLRRVSRDGVAGSAEAVLDDYACLATALLCLHQVTGEREWLESAALLLDQVLSRFRDPSTGGFFDTAHDSESLVLRLQDPTDNATPSGWSAAADALLTFAALTGSDRHRTAAEDSLAALVPLAARQPRFAAWGAAVLEAWVDGPREVAVIGRSEDPARAALESVARRATAAGAVVVVGEPGSEHPLLQGRTEVAGSAAAYVCRHFTCDAPLTRPELLAVAVGARALP